MPGEPCRGPSCSGDPKPQGAPVTSTNLHETQELWNLCIGLGTPDNSSRGNWLRSSQSIHPITRNDSIFHPPRQA